MPVRVSRRSAILAGGVLMAGLQDATGQEEDAVLIDTHLHCFDGADSSRFPYHQDAPYSPQESASPEFLLRTMDQAGVDFAVVVHPEPYQDDHRYLAHCLQVGGGRLKGTILVFADRPQSLGKMESLCDELDVVAVRVHAYAPDRLPPFASGELRELWTRAARLGIAVQLHFEPRYAPGFEPLIKEFPDVTVLIDHLGRPFQGLPEEHEKVVRWGDYPNTIMKLSSIPAESTYPHRDIRPILRQLIDAYGPDRLMYGGGFNASATGASYRAAFDRARQFLAHLSAADQAKILGGTAHRVLGFN